MNTLTNRGMRSLVIAVAFAFTLGFSQVAHAAWVWTGKGTDTHWGNENNWNKSAANPSTGIGAYFRYGPEGGQKNVSWASASTWDTAPLYVDAGSSNQDPWTFEADGPDSYGHTGNKPFNIGSTGSEGGDGYLSILSGTYSFYGVNVGQNTSDQSASKGWLSIGNESGGPKLTSTAYINVHNGELIVLNGIVEAKGESIIGNKGDGGLMIKGGKVTFFDNFLYVGNNGGTGTLTVSNGTVRVDSTAKFVTTSKSKGKGTIKLLNGGKLETTYIHYNDPGLSIMFDGGTLVSIKTTDSWIIGRNKLIDERNTITVGSNGGTIDTSGNAVKIPGIIADVSGENGSMTFKGGNTVTLSGANTYTGGTVIELGTKVIAGTAEAKNAVVNNLVVDGGKYFADTEGITVFEYSAGGLSLNNINVSFINCGDNTEAKVSSDGKKILVDFVARPWATVNGNTTWSALVEAVGGVPASDAIVSIKMAGNYTLTIDDDVTVGQLVFSTAGGSTLVVEGDKTLSVKGIEGIGIVEVQKGATFYADGNVSAQYIFNNGTVIKRVDDDVFLPFYGGSRGVYEVQKGTLKVSSAVKNAVNLGFVDDGMNQLVIIKGGATFDLNGYNDCSVAVRLEEKAILKNTRANIVQDNAQVKQLILTGNATVTASAQFGMVAPGHNETRIDLGENTLSVKGSSQFWLVNTTINGEGTVAVEENGFLYVTKKDVKGDKCTVRIGSKGGSKGQLAVGATMTVRNFINANAERIWGDGTLKVTGLFTLGETKITTSKMELGDGVTIKVTGTTPQEVSSAFSASGTIKVDTSEITADKFASAENGLIPVLTIPQGSYDSCKEAFKSWQISGIDASMRSLRWRQNGNNMTLYVARPGGTKIIIR